MTASAISLSETYYQSVRRLTSSRKRANAWILVYLYFTLA